jgi:hypothetical protein
MKQPTEQQAEQPEEQPVEQQEVQEILHHQDLDNLRITGTITITHR